MFTQYVLENKYSKNLNNFIWASRINKRKNRNARLQVDNEFQKVKINDLTKRFNVTMLTTSLRGGKTFAAEQKIRELKSRIAKLNAILDKKG